jgi:hypothetical protein
LHPPIILKVKNLPNPLCIPPHIFTKLLGKILLCKPCT